MFDRCLYFNVNALARKVNKKWTEAFATVGLSPAHGYMLRAVLAEPGLSHKQLGEVLQLEKSTVSRFVDALADKGLVVRRQRDDGREQGVYPRKKALQMQPGLEQLGEQLYEQMVAAIGRKNLTSLVSQLRQVAGKIE